MSCAFPFTSWISRFYLTSLVCSRQPSVGPVFQNAIETSDSCTYDKQSTHTLKWVRNSISYSNDCCFCFEQRFSYWHSSQPDICIISLAYFNVPDTLPETTHLFLLFCFFKCGDILTKFNVSGHLFYDNSLSVLIFWNTYELPLLNFMTTFGETYFWSYTQVEGKDILSPNPSHVVFKTSREGSRWGLEQRWDDYLFIFLEDRSTLTRLECSSKVAVLKNSVAMTQRDSEEYTK